MMSQDEQEDVRQLLYRELVNLQEQVAHQGGSYRYLCLVGGSPTFAHAPVGPVMRILR